MITIHIFSSRMPRLDTLGFSLLPAKIPLVI
jgi:hypothetical protein